MSRTGTGFSSDDDSLRAANLPRPMEPGSLLPSSWRGCLVAGERAAAKWTDCFVGDVRKRFPFAVRARLRIEACDEAFRRALVRLDQQLERRNAIAIGPGPGGAAASASVVQAARHFVAVRQRVSLVETVGCECPEPTRGLVRAPIAAILSEDGGNDQSELRR